MPAISDETVQRVLGTLPHEPPPPIRETIKHRSISNEVTLVLYIVGTLGLVALLLVVLILVLPGGERLPPGVMVSSIAGPVDLTRNGTRHVNWKIMREGDCVQIYHGPGLESSGTVCQRGVIPGYWMSYVGVWYLSAYGGKPVEIEYYTTPN
ncbi:MULTISPECIES: hypothetical protein [unclassified Mesorhizobium]|uniref:hypothetical protein n=1 Tax=unclassified Mesorhizobium TaxID=325217 RepID=UPI0003CE09AA|nr:MULTISPECIES: hypothetical protein [unclassified Mesorhizobium]ESY52079.1 hypothetical protein X745_20995 [Mesorhizobium sp. LNJC374B00]ESY55978.1 hypothetical protein X744_22375 [Mesorhizobium sp. LNJC372A00]WJI81277.1 hypothetical protein NLY34_00485 [Mesorhizobium sp. C374B]WJI87796.1 hypothetical protein NLY42_02900 [Mesorhizobium sp. C372A]